MAPTLEQLSPDKLIPNPNQPASRKPEPTLVASIKERGIIQPIVVAANDDGTYTIVAGHGRHTAALKLGLESVPALVHNGGAPYTDVDGLTDLVAENVVRKDMTSIEVATAVQKMLELGVDEKVVANAVGLTKTEIAQTKAIADAAAKLSKVNAAKQATLEEAAALAEFANDKDVLKDLTEDLGSGAFEHSVARARQDRTNKQTREDSMAVLKEQGCKLIGNDWDEKIVPLEHFKLHGAKVNPSWPMHKDCPGHAAKIDWQGKIVYVCTDAAKLHPDVTRGTGNGAGPKSDAQKAHERLKREARKQHKAAAAVRSEHIARIVRRKRAAGALEFIAADAWAKGLPSGAGYEIQATKKAKTMGFDGALPLQQLLILTIAQREYMLEGTIKATAGLDLPSASRMEMAMYFTFLTANGYPLAPCEEAMLTGKAIVADTPPAGMDTETGEIIEVTDPDDPTICPACGATLGADGSCQFCEEQERAADAHTEAATAAEEAPLDDDIESID